MDPSTATAFTLIGFLLAQVTSVLSGTPDEDLRPVAFVADDDGQRYRLFEGTTLEEMVARGKDELANSSHIGWSFAYEGFLTTRGKRNNAFFVHGWVKKMECPIVVAQTWHRGDGGEVILTGVPFVLTANDAPEVGRTKHPDPVPISDEQYEVVKKGMARNDEVRRQQAEQE